MPREGRLLWKTQVEAHPLARIRPHRRCISIGFTSPSARASPRSAPEPGYACCTFRGSLAALEIATGRIVWKTYLVADEPRPCRTVRAGAQQFGPAGVRIVAAPTIDAGAESRCTSTTGDSAQPDAPQPPRTRSSRWTWSMARSGGRSSCLAAGRRSSPTRRSRRYCARLASGRADRFSPSQRSGMVLRPRSGARGRGPLATQAAAPDAPGGIAAGAAADHRILYVAALGARGTAAQ